ncbi:MAG: hypothetical protein IJP14_05730 [Clostridia bacterium]|nr:hypothetical protein [Clostridia bacterium]
MFRKVTTVMVTVFLLLLSVPYRNIALAADSYTPIYTKADLDAVRKDLDGRYRLMNDLKFSKDDFSDTGWKPIGHSEELPFTGIFDGNGYRISGLYVNVKESYGGVFGYNTGTIRGLSVVDCDIQASVGSYDLVYAGGIAGYSTGTITDCHVSGRVAAISTGMFNNTYGGGITGYCKGGSVTGCSNASLVTAKTTGFTPYHDFHAGGIVGCAENSTVTDCYNTAATLANFCGGIVGMVWQGGTVERCWNSGTVAPSHYTRIHAGGIVGQQNDGIVRNCYNIAPVSADADVSAFVGGLVGDLCNGTVTAGYNLGEVTATVLSETKVQAIGGIIGNGEGTVSDCVYLAVLPYDTVYGTSCSYATMKRAGTYGGFDFDKTWVLTDTAYPFPTLRACPMIGSFTGPTDTVTVTTTAAPTSATTTNQTSAATRSESTVSTTEPSHVVLQEPTDNSTMMGIGILLITAAVIVCGFLAFWIVRLCKR